MSLFIQSALKDREIKIYGNGKQVRDILYIDDLVSLIAKFVNSDISGVWNVGGGYRYTISLLTLIQLLGYELKKGIKYSFYDWRPNDQRIYISDIRKAYEDFNWSPNIDPIEGIKKLIKWCKENEV